MENNVNLQKNVYFIRALGERNIYATNHKPKPDIVAIGWPDSTATQNLNSLLDYENNIQKISASKGNFSKASADFANFQKLKIDDIALIPDEDNIHICRVKSVSYFNSMEKDGYPIARKCDFIITKLRSVFSTALQEEFENSKLTVNLSQYWNEISKLI